MKRVIHFHRKPPVGAFSIEGLFATIRDALDQLGQHIEVATAPCESIGITNRLRNLWWARKHRGTVNHITGDINYIALVLPRSTVIITVHDLTTLYRLKGIKRWLYKQFWFSLPIRSARIVTVISQATKDDLCRELRLRPDRVLVIPNAVAEIFQPAPFAFNTACPRILQIGARPNKNVPRLLQALKGLKCHFHLVGCPDRETRQAIEESDIPHTLQEDLTFPEIYEAYCKADLVTLISTKEGFGLPIVEAQWVERPVITSNCSSMPEVAGKGACLVDPSDIAAIRHAIQRVVQDANFRATLIERGRQNRQRFQSDKIAQQYRALYCDLLK